MMFIDREMMYEYIPILKLERIIKDIILDEMLIIEVIKLSLLFPIASSEKDMGDWMYSRRQIGASIFIYWEPMVVL